MHNPPLVSICMPVYNAGKYLVQAIESALQQTYTHTEIIIVDDGSTDDTLHTALQYATMHSSIHVHQNEKNLGLVGNWTKAIELAQGEWIKLLFQDDYLEPHCVATMLASAISHQVAFVLCHRNFVFDAGADEKNKIQFTHYLTTANDVFAKGKYTPEQSSQILKNYLFTNVLGEPICTLFTKKIYNDVGGFHLTMRQLVDYEFVLKIVLNYAFAFIPEALVHFRIHNASTSSGNVLTTLKKDIAKKILSKEGDYIYLIQQIIYNPLYILLQQYWTIPKLEAIIKRLYLKSCRHNGVAITKATLLPIIVNQAQYATYKYNYIKYRINKAYWHRHLDPYIWGHDKHKIPKK